MTDDWNDLASAWQADAAPAAFDFEAFQKRMDRARLWRAASAVAGLAACALAGSISVMAMASGGMGQRIAGLAGLAYTLFGLAVELGRRRVPGAMAARTVSAALDWEIAALRSDIGYGRSGTALIAGALVFLAIVAAVLQAHGRLAPGSRGTFAVVAAALWLVGGGAHTLWMSRRRGARLARLEGLRAQLGDGDA